MLCLLLAAIFNMLSISACTRAACSWLMYGVWGTFSCVEFWERIPWTSSQFLKSLGLLWEFVMLTKKCLNLPFSRKFGSILAENKLFIHGWTFLRSAKRIIGGKDMWNWFCFLFILPLESTASFNCWVIISVKYFLPRFPKSFVEEEFRTPPSIKSSVILKGHSKRTFVFPFPFQ